MGSNYFGCGCGCTGGGGPTPVSLVGCSCALLPPSLNMRSYNETVDGAMFRTGTLTYQSAPSWFQGPTAFYGDQLWPDPVTIGGGYGHDGGGNYWPDPVDGSHHYEAATFRYYMPCDGNQFNLTRIYERYPTGSPGFQDMVLYVWNSTVAGNSCSSGSLVLVDGTGFAGVDHAACVTIYAGTGTDGGHCSCSNGSTY